MANAPRISIAMPAVFSLFCQAPSCPLGTRKHICPDPCVPCGGTCKPSAGGGLIVSARLKISRTPGPQRKKICRLPPRLIFLEPENGAVKRLRLLEIVHIERRLQNTFKRRGHGSAPDCLLLQADQFGDAVLGEAEQRAEFLFRERLAFRRSLISTMPPEPVMTKLASVSAAESSR